MPKELALQVALAFSDAAEVAAEAEEDKAKEEARAGAEEAQLPFAEMNISYFPQA